MSSRRQIEIGRGGAIRIGTALLVGTAVLGLIAGCGGSARRQQQHAMMMAAASPDSGAPGTVGGMGAPGTVGVAGPAGRVGKLVDEYSYRLAPGDLIDVKFPYHPEENERVPVRPDGRIGLQVIGDVMAAGLTVKELEEVIVEKSSKTLKDPVVSVVIAQLAEHKVYVGGQVAKPGYVPYREGLTPLQAIVERGGFVDDANTDEVLHITRVGDQVQTQRLDLEAVMDGESTEQVVMAPDDIIIVPRTFIGEADVWVDQWIRGLLPTVPRPGFDLNTLAF
ncbi:MAG TPA: polysaccharide biosynthesis/export family protein [Candidatus Binatia bacterium]